jgi:phosphoketolase
MIESLISSRTRINLLLKFFLNPGSRSYLRGLAEEFGESTNSIRLELNKFEQAGMLEAQMEGNRKMFSVNTMHPLFPDIRNIIFKYTGIDQLITHLIKQLGDLHKVYLTGDFARGVNSNIIDMIIIGSIDLEYFLKLVDKVEDQTQKKIKYTILNEEEWNKECIEKHKPLMLVYGN